MYLTLRTGCSRGRTPKVVRPQQRKNPLPYSFSQRSHIGNLRQIRKQGKGRSSKRKENRRLSFLFAHRRGYGVVPAAGRGTFPPSPQTANPPAEVQRKTLRPERANTLTQFAHPGFPVQEKEPPRQGEPADAVRAPHWVGAEKEPPRQGEHADAVRAPRSAGAGKGAARQGEHACGSSRTPLSRCSEKECRTRTLVHL